ncbi:isochorismatase family protein [Streptomyces sp. NPDC050549]|uniref:isochorismatase family protein n=1 Tax=Streptomyces sp. NPDC050549 TaxID=3155406 RepID=UPI0034398001
MARCSTIAGTSCIVSSNCRRPGPAGQGLRRPRPRGRRHHRLRPRRLHRGRLGGRPRAQPGLQRGRRGEDAAPRGRLDPDRQAAHPEDGDVVVRKIRHGSGSTTDLHQQLSDRGIDTLVLAGISTSGVVLSTVMDATDRDYRVLVLSDGVADPGIPQPDRTPPRPTGDATRLILHQDECRTTVTSVISASGYRPQRPHHT